jgi:hypothetical protein
MLKNTRKEQIPAPNHSNEQETEGIYVTWSTPAVLRLPPTTRQQQPFR